MVLNRKLINYNTQCSHGVSVNLNAASVEPLRLQVREINAAFTSAGTSQLLFGNKWGPVVVSEVHLNDKFTLIAKLRLVCQTHASKRHFQSDVYSNGQWRKSFRRNGNKCVG